MAGYNIFYIIGVVVVYFLFWDIGVYDILTFPDNRLRLGCCLFCCTLRVWRTIYVKCAVN